MNREWIEKQINDMCVDVMNKSNDNNHVQVTQYFKNKNAVSKIIFKPRPYIPFTLSDKCDSVRIDIINNIDICIYTEYYKINDDGK